MDACIWKSRKRRTLTATGNKKHKITAKKMIKKGKSNEEISEFTDLTIKQIEKLRKELEKENSELLIVA